MYSELTEHTVKYVEAYAGTLGVMNLAPEHKVQRMSFNHRKVLGRKVKQQVNTLEERKEAKLHQANNAV